MTRRFLTSEDVRRAGGPEILVDDGTVVTPQALEAAAAAGIVIRASAGEWHEPAPDRGPDAERAQAALPHLPEPEDDPNLAATAVVTAVGRNRAGVLAAITAAIAAAGGNVNEVSQKVIEGYFHMILVVELERGSFAALKAQLEALGGPDAYVVRVMNERVFRFMHRV
ncbi:MAG: ACT domain-containing protein [Planctomycetota bacterium]